MADPSQEAMCLPRQMAPHWWTLAFAGVGLVDAELVIPRDGMFTKVLQAIDLVLETIK
jgi:hypothetical protein